MFVSVVAHIVFVSVVAHIVFEGIICIIYSILNRNSLCPYYELNLLQKISTLNIRVWTISTIKFSIDGWKCKILIIVLLIKKKKSIIVWFFFFFIIKLKSQIDFLLDFKWQHPFWYLMFAVQTSPLLSPIISLLSCGEGGWDILMLRKIKRLVLLYKTVTEVLKFHSLFNPSTNLPLRSWDWKSMVVLNMTKL